MIQPHQYLKDIYQMTDEEKKVLAKRVYSIGVDDNSLDYDLQTLSALSRAHGFISVAHQLDSDRVWREMQGFVKIMKGILPTLPPTPSPGGGVDYNSHAENVQQTQNKVHKSVGSEKKSQKGKQSADKNASDSQSGLSSTPGDRPNHYDQWFDQMSETLQKKVAMLGDLHTKKTYYRQMVERLADNPNHSKQDMSLAATLTVNYEKKIQAIYNQAQIEWDELQGRSVSDDVKRIALQDEDKADKEIRKAEGGDESVNREVDESSNREVDESNNRDIEPSTTQTNEASKMTEDELAKLTVSEIQNSDLPDGPKAYFINKRIDLARGYLKKMTPETMTDEQKQKAIDYAQELAHAGKALSPKAKENLSACGIEVNN